MESVTEETQDDSETQDLFQLLTTEFTVDGYLSEPRASIVDFEQVSFNCVSWLGQSARVINLNFSLKYYFYNWHLYFF